MERRRKAIVLLAAVVALLAAAVAAYVGRHYLNDWLRGRGRLLPSRPLQVLTKSGAFAAQRVDIAAGTIEVVELFRFLGVYTGLPVVYDASDPRMANGKVVIAAPMDDVDAEVVRAVLEANGYGVDVNDLPGGKQALRVTATR